MSQFPASLPARSEILVLLADGSEWASAAGRFEVLLDEAERTRAERLRAGAARASFVFGRGLLRLVLGNCLGEEPVAVRLGEGPHGKPVLSAPLDETGLFFNLSRSGLAVAIVLARFPSIGIDVELPRDDLDFEGVARHAFSPRAIETWLALPESRHREAFFLNWTRKEALVKATGRGLNQSLMTFDVSYAPGDPPRVLYMKKDGPPSAWRLFDVDSLPGTVVAVAAKSRRRLSMTSRVLDEDAVLEGFRRWGE